MPIANKPALFYAIKDPVAAGFDDIGIVVGPTAPEIKQAVGQSDLLLGDINKVGVL